MATNYTVFTNLKATGEMAVGGNAAVTGNATVGGNLAVTGTLTAPGAVKLIKLGNITFEATSGEAVALYTLPKDAVLLKVYCVVTAAFNSGDSDVLILGTTATDDALMAAADITEATPATYQKDAWLVGGATGTAISAKLTKTGEAATTGAATFYALVCPA